MAKVLDESVSNKKIDSQGQVLLLNSVKPPNVSKQPSDRVLQKLSVPVAHPKTCTSLNRF